ncbi:MAG: muconate cycloisomerase [Planctomycetaceae bacterium]|nr:muconate cycloisomerase [Planctomycetaceae bacterium]
MKITEIESYACEIPLKPERRMISALGQHIVSRYVLVRVKTDDGLEGVGEATVMPRWSGESVWGTKALIDHVLAPLLIGLDPHDIATIDDRMEKAAALNWFTKSALEMACWDLQGKAAGKPVYELLGGPVRSLETRCRFSMGAYPLERATRRAQELVEEGFTTIKVKVGTNPEEDIARVRAVREVIGSERAIVIDANCGWDAPTAIDAALKMQELGLNVGVFEQPTTQGDYAALAAVRKAVGPAMKVMADDIVFDLVHARECIRNEAVDVVSIYPGKCGGIARTKTIVDYCAEHGIPCSMGSNLEWDVATAAMCHMCVALPNLKIEEFPGDILGPEYHEIRIARNPLKISGPMVSITDQPGLGVDVDWDVVRQHVCV